MLLTKTSWNKWLILVCMLPCILVYLVFSIIPSFATAVLSFTNISGLAHAPWKFIGLDNYKEFFLYQNYRDNLQVIKRTIVFAVSVTLIQNFFAMLVAVLLNNKTIKGRNFSRAVVFLPTILGVSVVGYAWTLFFTLDGPASTFLKVFGTYSGFLGSYNAAFPLVIFIQIWMSLGYAMVIYLAGMQGIPAELYEAGVIDGTSPSQAFRLITFPLLWPTITVNVLLSVIGSLSVVQTIVVTTGGAFNTATLAMVIYNSAFGVGTGIYGTTQQGGTLRQGFASAQSMILFFIILIFTLAVQYILSRREKDI